MCIGRNFNVEVRVCAPFGSGEAGDINEVDDLDCRGLFALNYDGTVLKLVLDVLSLAAYGHVGEAGDDELDGVGAGLSVIRDGEVKGDHVAGRGDAVHRAHNAKTEGTGDAVVGHRHGAGGKSGKDGAEGVGIQGQNVGIVVDLHGEAVEFESAVDRNDVVNGIAGFAFTGVADEGCVKIPGFRGNGSHDRKGKNHCGCNDCSKKLFHFTSSNLVFEMGIGGKHPYSHSAITL